MVLHRVLVAVLIWWVGMCACAGAAAQSTDGYHELQVFPVVVDTASFAQRFTFRNPYPTAITLRPQYFPAAGTTATMLTCPDFEVAAQASVTFPSLRALCPALAAGSQFGFLTVRVAVLGRYSIAAFSGFSRVANPQGNGFSVEAFPAHTFTSATALVTGVRRLAATAGTPAFQTNCFIGNLNELENATGYTTTVHYTLLTAAGATIAAADVDLAPGKITRLLDVFAIAPAGDYNDASVRFEEMGTYEPGILAFCTVQDNSSFGADFRIAKQEMGDAYTFSAIEAVGAQDGLSQRDTWQNVDALGNVFYVPPGDRYNVHEVYFRHPDHVMCELVNIDTNVPMTVQADNLEMWIQAADGTPVIKAVANYAWFSLYLGEKAEHNGGANGAYRIVVEDGDMPYANVNRLYRIHCMSGSGHIMGNMIRFNQFPDIR